MERKGFFEIEPAPGKPEGISVRIEPGEDGKRYCKGIRCVLPDGTGRAKSPEKVRGF